MRRRREGGEKKTRRRREGDEKEKKPVVRFKEMEGACGEQRGPRQQKITSFFVALLVVSAFQCAGRRGLVRYAIMKLQG